MSNQCSRWRGTSLGCLITLLTTASPVLAETVTVDASVMDGIVPAIHGVNNGPIISTLPEKEPLCGNQYNADFTQVYLDAGIPQTRFHGGAEVDLHLLWEPYPNFIGEDPTLEANYDWTRVDEVVANAVAAGTEIFVRIGNNKNEGWSPQTGTTFCDPNLVLNNPPNDFAVFGQVVKHIMMHISDGWDFGTFVPFNYLEVWNEFYIPWWWTGTGVEAAQLYEAVYAACKPSYPNTQFLPSINTPYNSNLVSRDFWNYVLANGTHIDGVAPHLYATHPYRIEERVYSSGEDKSWEDLFGEAGLPLDTPIYNSEWNRDSYNIGGKSNSVPGSTFVAASLIVMAEMHPANGPHALMMSHLFSARNQIWYENGTPKAPGIGLEAYGMMVTDTPNKLSITGGYTDNVNIDFRVISGKSNDGSKVNLLLTYYDTTLDPQPDNNHLSTIIPLTVDINNLPWGSASFTWERWAQTGPSIVSLQSSGNGSGGSFSTSQSMNANVLEYYLLEGPTMAHPEVWADFEWSGPQDGTVQYPFDSMHKAVDVVDDGGVIYVNGGLLTKAIVIDKLVRLDVMLHP